MRRLAYHEATYRGGNLFYWAEFLVIALVAAVAGTSADIAWILFVVGLIFAVVFYLTGRRGPGF